MMESLSQEAAAAQLLGRLSGIDENVSLFGCSFRAFRASGFKFRVWGLTCSLLFYVLGLNLPLN